MGVAEEVSVTITYSFEGVFCPSQCCINYPFSVCKECILQKHDLPKQSGPYLVRQFVLEARLLTVVKEPVH